MAESVEFLLRLKNDPHYAEIKDLVLNKYVTAYATSPSAPLALKRLPAASLSEKYASLGYILRQSEKYPGHFVFTYFYYTYDIDAKRNDFKYRLNLGHIFFKPVGATFQVYEEEKVNLDPTTSFKRLKETHTLPSFQVFLDYALSQERLQKIAGPSVHLHLLRSKHITLKEYITQGKMHENTPEKELELKKQQELRKQQDMLKQHELRKQDQKRELEFKKQQELLKQQDQKRKEELKRVQELKNQQEQLERNKQQEREKQLEKQEEEDFLKVLALSEASNEEELLQKAIAASLNKLDKKEQEPSKPHSKPEKPIDNNLDMLRAIRKELLKAKRNLLIAEAQYERDKFAYLHNTLPSLEAQDEQFVKKMAVASQSLLSQSKAIDQLKRLVQEISLKENQLKGSQGDPILTASTLQRTNAPALRPKPTPAEEPEAFSLDAAI